MSVRAPALVLVFLLLLASAILLAPLAAGAQQAGKVYRIGFLRAGRPPSTFVEGFQQGLRERGYVDGQNVVIEYRFTEESLDQLPQLAEELVRRNVNVILASAAPPAVAAQQVTSSVPIVFVGVIGPVELGLVQSLARPGGNITGLAISAADLAGKRLEFLREIVPTLRRVAVLWHPANPGNHVQMQVAEDAAQVLGVQLQRLPIQSPEDFEPSFKAAQGADGLLQLDDSLFVAHRTRLAELAARGRLPAIYGFREFVDAEGLMSYGAHLPDLYRRAATYVDKILKGAKPADLPVEQPMKYEFVINMKTAKALGLTIPPVLLFRADEVIE
jgi:putative tryptophan/tyrosine transport system substrate-binding protein